ncbi:helix-turn-helix transcriptional regulator [Vibrio parahaemolyticus]|nr:helix-turn-helix transcriptional regulator [Vibrio parahaemolyticus]
MERVTKAYWIGEPLHTLPEEFKAEFEQHFDLLDCSNDISVLSDKEFCYFFYYITHDPTDHAKSIATLCENLDKKLIVVTKENTECCLPPSHITAECYELNENTLPVWLSQAKLKYFLHAKVDDAQISADNIFPRNGKSNFSDVVNYIANNVHKDLREEEAAALCHYSPTYFSKVFHRKVGMCFRDYVTAKRISLAKKMLIENESMKIAYIAYQCGYRDVSYFSRIFKKKTGLSPANYRQQF